MTYTTSLTVKPGGAGDTLRTAANTDWEAAVDHRFVRELFAGTLDDEVLRAYVEQDYAFFNAGLALLGGCLTYAPNPESKIRFAKQLGMLSSDEDSYFTKALAKLDGENIQRTPGRWNAVTTKFNGLMHEAANSQNYSQMLIIMLVAEWLYLDWGERSDLGEPESWLYLDWIELHRGDDFRAWSQFLLDELEDAWPAVAAEQARLTELFKECVNTELEFFNAVY